MQLVKLSIIGFIAGFLATLIFHQGLWWLFNQTGVIPADRPAWPLDPSPVRDMLPPFRDRGEALLLNSLLSASMPLSASSPLCWATQNFNTHSHQVQQMLGLQESLG